MNATELLAVEASVAEVDPGAIPPDLADRARAYEAAVDAFHGVVRSALASLDRGVPVQGEAAAALRTSARELVAARDWLLDLARLPLGRRLARP